MANNQTHTSATPALRVGNQSIRHEQDLSLSGGLSGLRALQESFDKEQWDGLANVIYQTRDDTPITLNPTDSAIYVLSFDMPLPGAVATPANARVDWDGSAVISAIMWAAIVKRDATPTFPADYTQIGEFHFPALGGGCVLLLHGEGTFELPPDHYDIWFLINNPSPVQVFDVQYFYASLRRGRIPPS